MRSASGTGRAPVRNSSISPSIVSVSPRWKRWSSPGTLVLPRAGVGEHQGRGALGVAGREEHRHLAALGVAEQRRVPGAGGVHHGVDVVGPLLEGG
jgi:hypothetical protein